MRKLIILLILDIVLLSCSSHKRFFAPTPCNENLEFKRKFFYSVWVVEKYTIEQGRPITYSDLVPEKKFVECYDFLYKATKIPAGNILNYQIGYANYKVFKVDKKKWLEWYEENKCSYIK